MNTNMFPPVLITNYIWYEMGRIDPALVAEYAGIVPFFPLYDNKAGDSKWNEKTYVVYDTMTMRRRHPFYPIKTENLLLSVRGTVPQMLYFQELIKQVIDRQDDSAKDLNAWAGVNAIGHQVFFHSFSTSEQNWSSEITLAKTTRQPVSKDLIVEYSFHMGSYVNN